MNEIARFATKIEAEANATGRHTGFVAVFISDHYAAARGVSRGGWYLIYSRDREERYATK